MGLEVGGYAYNVPEGRGTPTTCAGGRAGLRSDFTLKGDIKGREYKGFGK